MTAHNLLFHPSRQCPLDAAYLNSLTAITLSTPNLAAGPDPTSLHIQFQFHMQDSAINALCQLPSDIQKRIGQRERN
jgi:hypothetical protein